MANMDKQEDILEKQMDDKRGTYKSKVTSAIDEILNEKRKIDDLQIENLEEDRRMSGGKYEALPTDPPKQKNKKSNKKNKNKNKKSN